MMRALVSGFMASSTSTISGLSTVSSNLMSPPGGVGAAGWLRVDVEVADATNRKSKY